MTNKFLVHAKEDYVGVATEDLKKDESVEGTFLDDNGKNSLKVLEEIPLGHKIALRDIKKGEKIIEYKEQIGVATKDIRKGEHVHIHNIKTTRW
jgi:(2R)-sulfolactate sulfo-lyase subunit alpha